MNTKGILFALSILAQNICLANNFQEVNEVRSSQEFKIYMQDALNLLKNHATKIGKYTYKSIANGRVKIDLLMDLTRQDFAHVVADYTYDDENFPIDVSDYEEFQNGNEDIVSLIESQLAGYMWHNRIYVHHHHTTYSLARTLVHEVNHVLNRSEVHYYESSSNTLREEYRAFLAEAKFQQKNFNSSKFRKKILRETRLLYGLAISAVRKVRSIPKGLFIPSRKNWSVNW